jgi:hypothetical protein
MKAQRRILLYVILPAAALYLGLKLYAQYRPVKIYVSRVAPMPAELAAGLHMQEHKMDPMVTIETPYESAENKILSEEEIRLLRRQIAWNGLASPFFDSLTIQSSNSVLIRRTTSRYRLECELARSGNRWSVTHSTRSFIGNSP